MPKKAFLIDVNITHRVVGDVPEKADELTILKAVWPQLMEKVSRTVNGDALEYDNVTNIEEDVEIPYGDLPEDH